MNTSQGAYSCVFMFIILFVLSFLETWVIQFLWNNFVPIFWTNAPILSFWETFGCILLISLLKGIISKSGK